MHVAPMLLGGGTSPLRRGRESDQARGHTRSCVTEGDASHLRRRLLIRRPSRSRT
jgi:hypothetical protein